MTVILWDTVTGDVGQIPADAEAVGGYAAGTYAWSAQEWARFKMALQAHIAVRATQNLGNVLDVETGDATPDQAPGWVQMRRAAGLQRPVVYCSLSQWGAVRAAFHTQGVAEPDYWIAQYTGVPHCPAGAVACQWADPTRLPAQYRGLNLDASLVVDPSWLIGYAGPQNPPIIPISPEDDDQMPFVLDKPHGHAGAWSIDRFGNMYCFDGNGEANGPADGPPFVGGVQSNWNAFGPDGKGRLLLAKPWTGPDGSEGIVFSVQWSDNTIHAYHRTTTGDH